MAVEYGTEEWEKEYGIELARRMQVPPPYIFFTPEWAALYEKKVQGDDKYKKAAKNWEGTVVLHIEAKPEVGLDIDLYIFMDLWHGDCGFIRVVPTDAGEAADFVITGTLENWTKVCKKEMNVVKGMMQDKLILKGDLGKITRAITASARLVDLSAEVGGKFPDELSTDEIEEFRCSIKDFSEMFF